MDVNVIRIAVTVSGLVLFIALVLHTLSLIHISEPTRPY